MSESESIKADIAFHEKMFFTAIAALMTLIGWMASNYTTANSFFAGTYVVYQYRLIKRLIKELKNV